MLIGHPIIIKQPEHFPKSDRDPKSMIKLVLNEPAITEIVKMISVYLSILPIASETVWTYVSVCENPIL